MANLPKEAEPAYSNRLLLPWLAVLRRYPEIPSQVIADLETRDLDGRTPASRMIEGVQAAVALTGDPDLGLKAAQASSRGDYDVLEFAAASASTGREALDILLRYVGLVNDGIDIDADVRNGLLFARTRSVVALDRASADFQSAAFHVVAKRWLQETLVAVEVSHRHPQPEDLSEYRKVYGDAVLRFGEPYDGVVYDASVLDATLRSANPQLHHVLQRHAAQMLAALPRIKPTGEQVRGVLVETLSSGLVTVEAVAARLHISRRTLARRLEAEGTNYKELLDEVRGQLAASYLTDTSIAVGEVAFMLGFSQGSAFNRAFKRWTGRTPLKYRRERRG